MSVLKNLPRSATVWLLVSSTVSGAWPCNARADDPPRVQLSETLASLEPCEEHGVVLCKEHAARDAQSEGALQRLEHDMRGLARRQRYKVGNGSVGAGGFKAFDEVPLPLVDPLTPALEYVEVPAGGSPGRDDEDAEGGGDRGLPALEPAPVETMLADLSGLVCDGEAALALGKALYWDMQVGSDGRTACATCHFHAGADTRTRHNYSATVASAFRGPNREAPLLGPTAQGAEVYGSAGVVRRIFDGFGPGERPEVDAWRPIDEAYVERARRAGLIWGQLLDEFVIGGHRVRQVTTRNSPTSIGAAGYDRQFHDGRASNEFNGFDFNGDAAGLPGYHQGGRYVPGVIGSLGGGEVILPLRRELPAGASLDPRGVWKLIDGQVERVPVRIPNASLASQAVGPTVSEVEMSWDGRKFYHVGHKMLEVVDRPLAGQEVHPEDSVLGPYAAEDGDGLHVSYRELIEAAFGPEWWEHADGPVFSDRFAEYSQMEANFALFFGISVMLYESTLVPDDSPFDRYARRLFAGPLPVGEGLPIDAEQLRGFELFRTAGCIDCHGLPEFSSATLSHLRGPLREGEEAEDETRLVSDSETELVELMELIPLPEIESDIRIFLDLFGRRHGEARRRDLQVTYLVERFYDGGFYNLGVRPSVEDPGVGGSLRPDLEPGPIGVPTDEDRQESAAPLNDRYLLDTFAPEVEIEVLPGLEGIEKARQLQRQEGQAQPEPGPSIEQELLPREAQVMQYKMESRSAPGGEEFEPAGPGLSSASTGGVAAAIEFSLARRLHPRWRTAVNGAFKSPTLRNVELTGPYMHNGGLTTLRDVVEFYDHGGDFGVETNLHKHPEIEPLGLTDVEVDALVAFLETLTDDRVRYSRAPFDHPELVVPVGYLVGDDGTPVEDWKTIEAVGIDGRESPLMPFPSEDFP